MTLRAAFARLARLAAHVSGQPATFILAVMVIGVWAATGPMFGFSDTWQLIINTGTTIITFLMVFLIQSTQNTDTKAMHLKLDEIVRSLDKARDDLIGVENRTEDQLDRLG